VDAIRIMEERWDHLLILDACRYDYFAQVWGNRAIGNLAKRHSVGSSTLEWRDNSFRGRYEDVVYVSSNPYVNSITAVKGFLGTDHFFRVYDVWRTDWNEGRGTVLPGRVTSAVIRALRENPGKRTIVHYLQPHAPYLALNLDSGGFPVPDLGSGQVLVGTARADESKAKTLLLRMMSHVCYRTGILGRNPTWQLRQLLRMKPASPMDAARRLHGDGGLKEAYRANLEIVLAEVLGLLKYLGGRIIITSDHGELLGEGGHYSHWIGSTNRHLLEIPWLVIDKEQESEIPLSEAIEDETAGSSDENPDEAQIRARLRALGYID
jgi:hypothetical protein